MLKSLKDIIKPASERKQAIAENKRVPSHAKTRANRKFIANARASMKVR